MVKGSGSSPHLMVKKQEAVMLAEAASIHQSCHLFLSLSLSPWL